MSPLLPLLPLRLCRPCPRSTPTRLLGAAGQRSGPNNYYELLGVHPGASPEEIKRAFFTKSKELHPDRDPGNPALHSRFVELSEAYHVLSHEQSRRSYDYQLRSWSPSKPPGAAAHPSPTCQAHSSSWAPRNAQYWAQFHSVMPQGPEARWQQRRRNQLVLGYCLLFMLAGMVLHYVAFRKLEQMHRNFMDEKDRIITAIYNDTRARARARLQQERLQRQQLQPGPPQDPAAVPPASGYPGAQPPGRPHRPACRLPLGPPRLLRLLLHRLALRCRRPGLGRGLRRNRPPRPAPVRGAMGPWLPPG
ncbi:dnaJ homolog subfamily C member 4 [Rhynchocyon petersi]